MNNGIFKFKVFRRRSAACKAVAVTSALAMLALTPVTALSAPTAITGSVTVLDNVNGGAVISGVTGNMTLDTNLTAANINLVSGGAGLINWSALNVGDGQTLGFTGGDFYNVVGGTDASKIAGQLNASGSLWIFNPAGVSFMNGAKVNVGGLFGVAAAGLENESSIKEAIEGGTAIPDPTLLASDAMVSVANGAEIITGGDLALAGRSVDIESGAKLSKVNALKVGAGRLVDIDDVGDGKVKIDITQFADVDDDINVTFGGGGEAADIIVGGGDANHAGDVEVVTEGNILVNEAVKANGDITFKTLAKEGAEIVEGHKQMSVASGKLLQGKSVSATAAGRVSVGDDVEAVDGDVSIKSGEYVNVAKTATITATGDVTIEAVGNVNMGGAVAAAENVVLKATGGADETAKSVKVGFDGSADNADASVSGKNVTMEGKMSSQVLAGSVTATGTDAKDGVTMSGGEYVAVNGAVSGKNVTLETTVRATLSKDHAELGMKEGDPAGVLVLNGSGVTATETLNIDSKGAIVAQGSLSAGTKLDVSAANDIDISGKVDSQTVTDLKSENGEIRLSNAENVIAGTVNTKGDVDISAGENVNFDYGTVEAGADGNLTIQGNAKDVTIKEAVAITGDFTVEGAGDISIESGITANDVTFKGAKTTVAGDVAGHDLAVQNAGGTASADLKQTGGTMKAGEKIVANITQAGCEIDTPVHEGNLTQTHADDIATVGEITGDVTQSAGLIRAKNTEHDYVNLSIDGSLSQTGGGKISDVGTLTIGKTDAAATAVSQDAAGTIEATAVVVNVVDGTDVTLAGSANKLGSVSVVGDGSADGDAKYRAGAVSVTDAATGGIVLDTLKADTLTVTAAGDVSQLGAADVAGLADVTAVGAGDVRHEVSLLAPANKFGSVKAKGDIIRIKEADDVVVAGADATGMLLVEAGRIDEPLEYTASIAQTGAIKTGSGARFYGKSVTITHEENAMGPKITARADDGDVEIVNGGTISVDSINMTASGAVKLTAKSGNVEIESGAEISAASLELTAEDGNITLSGKATAAAGDVRAKAAGSLTVSAAEAVKVSGQNIRLEATDGALTVGAGVSGVNVTLKASNGISENAAVNATADKYVTATDGDINVNANATVGGNLAYVADGETARVKTDTDVSLTPGSGGVFFKKDSAGTTAGTGGASSKDGVTTFTDVSEVAIDTTDSVVVNNNGMSVTVGSYTCDATITEVLADPAGGTGNDGMETVQLGGEPVEGITAKDVTINVTGDPGATAVSVEKPIIAKNGDVTIDAEKGDVVVDGATVKAGTFTVDLETGAVTIPDGAAVGNLKIKTANAVVVKNAAQVGASGTVDVDAKAGGVTVTGEGTVLAANGVMTVDADGGDVEVSGKAFVGGNSTVSVGADNKTANVTVDGAQLVAKDSLSATATDAVSVNGGAKVASDAAASLEGASVTVDGTTTLVAAKGNVTLTATGTDVTVDKATVKAGSFSVDPDTGAVDTEAEGYTEGNLTIAAENAVLIQGAAQVGASGTVDVDAKAGGVTVTGEGTALAANGAATLDADGGDVEVSGKAFVGGNSTVSVGADNKTANVTVDGARLVAKEGLTAAATDAVSVKGGAKVASDAATTLTGASVSVADAATLVAAKGNVALTATGTDVTVDKATVKAGSFAVDPETGAVDTEAEGYTEGNLVVDAKNAVEVKGGAQVGASGTVDVDAKAGGVTVTGEGTALAANGAMTIDADGGDVEVSGKAFVGGNSTVSVGADGKTASVGVSGGTVAAKKALTANATGMVLVEGASKVASDTTATLTGANVMVIDEDAFVGAKEAVTIKAVGVKSVVGGELTITDGAVTIQEATVKAGSFTANPETGAVDTEAEGYTEGNLVIDADNSIYIGSGAQVGASGTVDVDAGQGGVQVVMHDADRPTRLVANKAMTIDAGTVVTDGGNDTVYGGGVTVMLDAYVGGNDSVTIGGAGTAKSVAVYDGTVAAKGALAVTATDAVSVRAGSKVAADATTTLKGASVTVDGTTTLVAAKGNVTLTATGTDVTVDKATVKAGDFSVNEETGAVTIPDGAALADLTVTANGKIAISGGAEVGASDEAHLTANGADGVTVNGSKLAANGNMTIDATKEDAGSVDVTDGYVGTHGTLGITAAKDVTINTSIVESTDDLTIEAEGDVTVGAGSRVGTDGNLEIMASGSTGIKADGALVADENGKTATLTAANGTIDAQNNAANDFRSVTATAKSVTLGDKDDVSLTYVAATEGDATVTAGSMEVGEVRAVEQATLTATDGDITAGNAGTANVTAERALFDAASGAVGAGDGHVEISAGVVAATSKNGVFLTEEDGVTIGTVGEVSGLKSTDSGAIVVEATAGSVVVDQAVEAKGADGNVLIAAKADDGDVTVGAAVTASQNATVSAGNDVYVDADVAATAGDAYVEARKGAVEMSSGTTIKGNADSGTAFVGAAGTLKIASVSADTVWLKTGGSIENSTMNGGVKADNLLLDAGGHIGTSADKLQVDVDTIAAKASGGGVYLSEANSFAIGSVNASVEKVEPDGGLATPKFSGGHDGIAASGDVSLDANDSITVASNVAADGNVDIVAKNGNVDFAGNGQVGGSSVTITAGIDITQEDATVKVNNGYAVKTSVRAAVSAQGEASLVAGGSIGTAKSGTSNYVGVNANSVSATAGGDAAIAGAEGSGIQLGTDGISAGKNVALYTSRTIRPNGKTVRAGGEVAVTAGDFSGGIVGVSVGSKLTANNLNRGSTLLAIFETRGGNKTPNVNTLPNKAVVFIDGRLAGGDLQTINKLGAMEAFPVQTPELKSEQGIFGNPVFLHDELDVANPLAVGAIDFLLLDIPRLTLSSDFPLEVEKQVAAAGLNPTTSYWFGQKSNEEEKEDAEGKPGEGSPSDAKGGGDAPTTESRTAMN